MKNYKIMALIPLLMLAGCRKQQEHKNVITGIVSNDIEEAVFLKSVETGQERILLNFRKNKTDEIYNYLKTGDTISIVTGGSFVHDKDYQRFLFLFLGDVGMNCNMDSLYARQQREQFNKLKTNTTKTR